MQPIPQASLDPKLKDIGQLRADQEFLWSDRLFRSSLTTPAFQNITQIVRILPPPRAWIGARPGICKTPVICRLARLEKRLDFRCATRNTTPQAPCTELHGRYRTPKQLARNAKNPGKTRVLQRRGQEPNFSMFFQCFWMFRKAVAVESQ
jgi:hypothetical protein